MPPVKTYIKDAILHDYTDKKKAEQVPTQEVLWEWCKKRLELPDLVLVENINQPWYKIMLFASHSSKTYVVVSDGSYKQWGIAVQKALLYCAEKPFAKKIGVTIRLVLSLYCRGTPVSHIEKEMLATALNFLNGKYRLYGE